MELFQAFAREYGLALGAFFVVALLVGFAGKALLRPRQVMTRGRAAQRICRAFKPGEKVTVVVTFVPGIVRGLRDTLGLAAIYLNVRTEVRVGRCRIRCNKAEYDPEARVLGDDDRQLILLAWRDVFEWLVGYAEKVEFPPSASPNVEFVFTGEHPFSNIAPPEIDRIVLKQWLSRLGTDRRWEHEKSQSLVGPRLS